MVWGSRTPPDTSFRALGGSSEGGPPCARIRTTALTRTAWKLALQRSSWATVSPQVSPLGGAAPEPPGYLEHDDVECAIVIPAVQPGTAMTAHGDVDRCPSDTGPRTVRRKLCRAPPILALDNKNPIRVGRSSLAARPATAGTNLSHDRRCRLSAGGRPRRTAPLFVQYFHQAPPPRRRPGSMAPPASYLKHGSRPSPACAKLKLRFGEGRPG